MSNIKQLWYDLEEGQQIQKGDRIITSAGFNAAYSCIGELYSKDAHMLVQRAVSVDGQQNNLEQGFNDSIPERPFFKEKQVESKNEIITKIIKLFPWSELSQKDAAAILNHIIGEPSFDGADAMNRQMSRIMIELSKHEKADHSQQFHMECIITMLSNFINDYNNQNKRNKWYKFWSGN